MSKGDVYRIGPTHEYVEQYRRPCHGCGKEIAFAEDSDGRWHAFDPDTGESHFASCKHADMFRKKAPK